MGIHAINIFFKAPMKKFVLAALMSASLLSVASEPTIKFTFTTGAGSYSHTNINIYSTCLKSLGAHSTLEFKPGAVGQIAVQSFINDKPQPGVLPVLVSNTGMHFFATFNGINLATDIDPLIAYTVEHLTVVANVNGPKSMADLKKLAETRPITVGAATPTGVYIANYLFPKLNIPHTLVQYKNGTAAVNDLLGGHIDLSVEIYPGVKSLVDANKLTVFTSTFTDPSKQQVTLPDLIPSFVSMTMSVRPDATESDKEWLISVMQQCNKSPTVIDELTKIGSQPRTPMLYGSAFRDYIKKYYAN